VTGGGVQVTGIRWDLRQGGLAALHGGGNQ